MKKYHVRLSIRHTLMIFMFSVVFALCVSVVINNDRMMQKLVSEYMGVWSKQIIDSVSSEMNATFQYVDRIVNSLVNSSSNYSVYTGRCEKRSARIKRGRGLSGDAVPEKEYMGIL